MRFFHKVALDDGNGGSVENMVHGAQLAPRWQARAHDTPPIADKAQWNAGEALVEQHHPFVGPLTGAMYAGPRCNHHISVLLRLPIPDGSATGASALSQAARVDEAVAAMAKLLNDANYYCGKYCGKDQQKIDNLFKCLAQAHASLKNSLGDCTSDAVEDVLYRAKRVVYRMMTACNRRMHKGMPEMIAFLLDEDGDFPELFSSHPFRPLFVPMLLAAYEAAVARRRPLAVRSLYAEAGLSETMELVEGDNSDGSIECRNSRVDYECRPAELSEVPFYYFLSAFAAVPRSKSSRLLFTQGHPLHKKLALQFRSKSPWKVPVLHGPAMPNEQDDPHKRAVMLQLLFRPWTSVSDLLPGENSEVSEGWAVQSFNAWHSELRSLWEEWRVGAHTQGRRPRLSADSSLETRVYWAYLILQKIRNADLLAMKRTEPTVPAPPATNGDGIAVDNAVGKTEAEQCGLTDSDAEQEAWQRGMEGYLSEAEDDRLLGELLEDTHQAKHDPQGMLQCGAPAFFRSVFEIATGTANQAGAAAELSYAARLQRIAAERLPCASGQEAVARPAHTPFLEVGGIALTEQQAAQDFHFQTLDDPNAHVVDELRGVDHDACRRAPSDMEAATVKVLGRYTSPRPSRTIVWESAFHLISCGLLNIPKTARVNRKQALFFLHFASWVQAAALRQWHAAGALAASCATTPPLRAVLLGGPGTGKTTLATVCKVFAKFWVGEDADAAGAPSHAAARLI